MEASSLWSIAFIAFSDGKPVSTFPENALVAAAYRSHRADAPPRRPKSKASEPCRSSGGRRIMAPNEDRARGPGCLPRLGAPRGGRTDVGQDLRRAAGVEAARLYRRGQVQGDVRALDQGPERI